MEFVCIEAKTFMEMNEALEAVAKKMTSLLERCCSFAEAGPSLTVI